MGKTTRRKNTANLIPHAQLTTAFNPFGKIDCISDEGSGYRTDFTYGPDGERWISVLHQGNTLQRTVYYMGDYEEIVEGGTIRRFYYLDGNVLYKKQTGCPDSVFYLFTDHLGSIVSIVDRNGSEKFSAAYDAWGNQTVTRNDIGFHRGYTGHEMLPEFGLINMNGRLYDPLIGRFLSTDNYVQEPWNSQNFNRYSYSLNNPLKYTDPSGEFFLTWSLSMDGFSIGVNIGFWGCGINIGCSQDGLSLGVYGELGPRVGGTGFGSGATVSYNLVNREESLLEDIKTLIWSMF
jgi:RHS repeat-associated protein